MSATVSEIIIRVEGRAGRITLDRPKALNALTYDQVLAITSALERWRSDPAVALVILDGSGDRGLCAGGDVRAMYDKRVDGPTYAYDFWRDEYRLNAMIARYPKPFVALMDGIVMGGGIGLSAHASHRIVTERSMLAMPETSIGLIPDVGGSWLLAHAPGRLGEYLGLLGERMGASDAIYAGFADTHVASERLADLIAALAAPGPTTVGVTIAHFAVAPPPTVHAQRQGEIDRVFAAGSVAAIRDGLAASAGGSAAEWAAPAVAALDARSPLALALTLAAVRNARTLASLEAALDVEFRLTNRLYRHGEFIEGVRALIVDKDKAPRWNPATSAAVSSEMVRQFMAPLPAGEELNLAARSA